MEMTFATMSTQHCLKRFKPALSNVRDSFFRKNSLMENRLFSETEGQTSDVRNVNTESGNETVEGTQLQVGTFVAIDGYELEFEIGQILISEEDPDKKDRIILVLWFKPIYDDTDLNNPIRFWCRHHRYKAQYRPRILQKPSLPQVSRLDESSVLTTFAELTVDSRLPIRTQDDIHFDLETLLKTNEQ